MAQAAAEKIKTVATSVSTAATGANTAATNANTASVLANTKALLTNPYVLAAMAIIGLTIAIAKLTKGFNDNNKEIEKAQKATEAARKTFEETQNKINDINTALTGWQDAVGTLNELEEGTSAWKQQLIEANNQVLKLLDTYPQLAQYISADENGLLSISAEGLKFIQEENLKKLEAAQVNYASAQRNEAITQKGAVESNLASNTGMGTDAASKILAYGLENGNAFLSACVE